MASLARPFVKREKAPRVVRSQSAMTRPQRFLARLVGADSVTSTHKALWGYLFLTPHALGLLLFVTLPILASIYLSFTEYNIFQPPKWIGLANYRTAFFEDWLFWPSLLRTFEYAFLSVPLGLIGSLTLAILLNQPVKAKGFFRTLYFLPSITPGLATIFLWNYILHPTIGPVNWALSKIGIQGPTWFADKTWALPSLVFMDLWGGIGGGRMLIFLAGLQGVPESLYEAAELDGAGSWARFWHITLPMISPTMLFNLVLGVIGALQVFTSAFVATQGGPAFSTWFYALHVYQNAFEYFRMGYASALAWLFAIIVLVFTAVQLSMSRKWVFYAGESGT